MGAKGDSATQEGALAAELFIQKLGAFEEISSKKMFGGHGIFHKGKMFGMVAPKGGYYLKANDQFKDDFIAKGAVKHSRMPYYSVPNEVFDANETLVEWASKSISIL